MKNLFQIQILSIALFTLLISGNTFAQNITYNNPWHRVNSPYGSVQIGPANTSGAHIYTDMSKFFFNKPVWAITGEFSAYSDRDLKLQTRGTTRMTILESNGNVGIGTTNPQYKLDVNAPARIKQVFIGGNPGGGGFNDGVAGYYNLHLNAAGSNNTGGDVVLLAKGSEKMRVKSNGNVGIGTNNPTHKLTVESGSGGGLLIKNSHGNSYLPWTDGRAYLVGKELVFRTTGNEERMRIKSNGNVGIGTDSPSYKLQVSGSGRINSVLIGTDLNGNTAGFANHVAGIYSLRLRASKTNNSGGHIIFDSGTSEKMRLNSSGQLLINTTSAHQDYKLGVNGKIICEGMRVRLKAHWPDYVFDKDYNLMSLEEVETQIKENKHLPGVPSAKEIAETGLDIETMQVKMMEKIEELTLYIIEQDKQIRTQQTQINELMKDK